MKIQLYVTGTDGTPIHPDKTYHAWADTPELKMSEFLKIDADELWQRYVRPAFEAVRERFRSEK